MDEPGPITNLLSVISKGQEYLTYKSIEEVLLPHTVTSEVI